MSGGEAEAKLAAGYALNRRRLRAMEGPLVSMGNLDTRYPIFSNFRVKSQSSEEYSVESLDR